jgi:hypothetical protein
MIEPKKLDIENELAIVSSTFEMMNERPSDLEKALSFVSEQRDRSPALTVDDLMEWIRSKNQNEPAARIVSARLAQWDYLPGLDWARDVPRNTSARRTLIYNRLGLSESHRVLFDERFPYAPALDLPITITEDRAGWQPWYSSARQKESDFYWKAYTSYLQNVKRFDSMNLATVLKSTEDIVARFSDPTSKTPYQVRGLVVGYVQSGKTTNFTGVIARASDAGYRLVIVLAGTINILREQTQRRIDKELIGKEMCTGEGYESDADYDEFVSYGTFPSELAGFDWERLTGAKEDFKRLKKGISALEFRKYAPAKPFYHPENLFRERARLVVVKKNTTVLDKLIGDLEHISKKTDLSAVPALVIDDESDQASINTIGPVPRDELKRERENRSATNKRIVRLLKLLPRAQYVGYTATPFANVFIDPEDTEDLFPRDFILSLPRPNDYMGVRDFYDEDEPIADDFTSNRNAFVRFVRGDDYVPTNLPQALDAYVLAGALKLYREAKNPEIFSYKHHTMLVHNSPWVNAQADQAKQIEDLFFQANYAGGGPGLEKLEKLWTNDFAKVSKIRGSELPRPKSFGELASFVGECCGRISDGPKPVLIVNGNNKDDSPDFEKSRVWKILVGGAKLSRGYTVEGLTVSYYRRRAGAADTLMQMGRWFGFRPGYRDLVRLYIGNHEPTNSKATKFIDLYEAFRATCLDEEEFRSQLGRYSSLDPSERITPRQVPPLVPQHLLRPTATNKMFNARIVFQNLGGEWRESTGAPVDDRKLERNEQLAQEMLRTAVVRPANIWMDALDIKFPALTSILQPKVVRDFLAQYKWLPDFDKSMIDVIEYLDGVEDQAPEIDRWLLLAPQLKGKSEKWTCDESDFSIKERARTGTESRYGVYSEPEHHRAARYFALVADSDAGIDGDDFRYARQAVIVFYPVRSADETKARKIPTMGFALQFPRNHTRKQIAYTVADKTRSDAIVVPAVAGSTTNRR